MNAHPSVPSLRDASRLLECTNKPSRQTSLQPPGTIHIQLAQDNRTLRLSGSADTAPHPTSARLSSAPAPKRAISASPNCPFGELSPTDLMQPVAISLRRFQDVPDPRYHPGHPASPGPFRSCSQIDRVGGPRRRFATATHSFGPNNVSAIALTKPPQAAS
ncbi:hypothetical protein FALBO_4059 [Fusarium albosuccineum]|uniref:Uncharacterized protein n=1 Tax=Fusarium albosuccineum TaxID=1237068 RepID=A0A8H4LGL3_9HYPO|nr:hypothetical protein FALBO_4059 [Fusarium albosuccineum]